MSHQFLHRCRRCRILLEQDRQQPGTFTGVHLRHVLITKEHTTRGGPQKPIRKGNQGRFPRSVLADDAGELPRFKPRGEIVQRWGIPVGEGYAIKIECQTDALCINRHCSSGEGSHGISHEAALPCRYGTPGR